MRIISQDGNIDVPYEQVSVERMGTTIWCGYNATLEKSCTGNLFSEYSRQEKAEKAMEMLHDAYQKSEKAKAFGKSYPLNSIFQFPQDSEIEV